MAASCSAPSWARPWLKGSASARPCSSARLARFKRDTYRRVGLRLAPPVAQGYTCFHKWRFFPMSNRIIIDPEIQHGKPVIRGTRVPVARIVGGLAGGMSKEDVIREYAITEEDVLAALSYAAE